MKRSLAVFVCLVLLLGCGKSEQHPVESRPLIVGWFLWSGWYPMAIAQELKLFEKHGVTVKPVLYNSYTEILPDLGSGKIDAGFSGMYETLKANIPEIKIILVTDYSEGAEGVVVTPDIKTPRDLKGKSIGFQGALSGSEFMITTYLRKHGISPRDLMMINISPEAVLDQIPGRIQAGYTWDPFLSRAHGKGLKVLFTSADMPGLIVDIVAFHGSVARERPQDMKKFIDAWFEAVDYWRTNPEKAASVIAKVTGLQKSEITLTGCRLLNREDNLKAFKEGTDSTSLYFTATKQVDFFITVGDATVAPDIKTILTPAYLH